MKKTILTFIVIPALTFFAVLFFGFRAGNENEQKYKVEYTVPKWESKIQLLEAAKNIIKQSDIAAKVALPLSDSLTAFENEIIEQVKIQMPKDTIHKK